MTTDLRRVLELTAEHLGKRHINIECWCGYVVGVSIDGYPVQRHQTRLAVETILGELQRHQSDDGHPARH